MEDGIDAVVRVGLSKPDSNLIMQSLGMGRDVVCASPQYREKWGVPYTPEDLQQHTCINHGIPQTGHVRE
ncbi:MAG: LysR substrate-binding domain-containing protein [Cyanobacteria bacterium J06626_18]